jgi:hypothetical protein
MPRSLGKWMFFVGISLGIAGLSQADCLRSCNAMLRAAVSYQPKGQPNALKRSTTRYLGPKQSVEGRYGGGCTPSGIHKAKERACEEAAEALQARYASPQAQMQAICTARSLRAQGDCFMSLFHHCSDLRYAIPDDVDWFKIEIMEAYAERDDASRTRNITPASERFKCDGAKVIIVGQ